MRGYRTDILQSAITEARKLPLLENFIAYCEICQTGLRKEALKHLMDFKHDFNSFSFGQKMDFAVLIFELCDKEKDEYELLPYPVKENLLKPFLLDWTEIESKDSRPFRWLGHYYWISDYFEKALLVNEKDDLARQQFIRRNIYWLCYSTHHLPDYYVNDLAEDLEIKNQLFTELEKLDNEEQKAEFRQELTREYELIESYSEWNISGKDSFMEWAILNGRPFK